MKLLPDTERVALCRLTSPPPSVAAALSETVVLVSASSPSSWLWMPPPPPDVALLRETVEPTSSTRLGSPDFINPPAFATPPPTAASFSETVLSETTTGPLAV